MMAIRCGLRNISPKFQFHFMLFCPASLLLLCIAAAARCGTDVHFVIILTILPTLACRAVAHMMVMMNKKNKKSNNVVILKLNLWINVVEIDRARPALPQPFHLCLFFQFNELISLRNWVCIQQPNARTLSLSFCHYNAAFFLYFFLNQTLFSLFIGPADTVCASRSHHVSLAGIWSGPCRLD